MQKISPFLWFDNQAEEAVKFYTSLFEGSKMAITSRYGDAGPGPKGQVMGVTFQLAGLGFMALNGGPTFTFTPAVSFFVSCKTERELDALWKKLFRARKSPDGAAEVPVQREVRVAFGQVRAFLAVEPYRDADEDYPLFLVRRRAAWQDRGRNQILGLVVSSVRRRAGGALRSGGAGGSREP